MSVESVGSAPPPERREKPPAPPQREPEPPPPPRARPENLGRVVDRDA